ncbi:MAG: hypothetical protein ACREO7_05615 [Pseudoxanthomonas sp.]
MRDERTGKNRDLVPAAMRGMHERMQQVDAFFLRSPVGDMLIDITLIDSMVMGAHWLRVLRTAMAGFVQVADCGEHGIDQHRKHEQCQRGKAQQSDNAVAGKGWHRACMLRDASPVKQLQR